MCLAVYAAAPRPLPLVPWDDDAPGFFVLETVPDDPARRRFPWPHVYFVGSAEGCGCGFAYGPQVTRDAAADARARADVAALRRWVAAAAAQGPVQLYPCRDGDQALPERERTAMTPEQLGGDAFDLPERVLLELGGRAGPPRQRFTPAPLD